MKKKDWLIITPFFLIFALYYINWTYGLFESDRTDTSNMNIAKWQVKVNDDILSGSSSTFVIDRVNWDSSTNVKNGKAAPGTTGSFDIEIDPNGTDTSIRYDIFIDLSVFEGTAFSIDRVIEINDKPVVRTGYSTYSNIITLDEINNNETNTIRAFLTWANDETKNEVDTEIANGENGKFRIPVKVDITQHFSGEQLIPYSGE